MTKKIIVGFIGFVSGLYLINPGWGIFELIPDHIPFIGNLDEGGATFLLLSSLAYFGLDLRHIFGKLSKQKNNE
jgi:hypothetical protein